MFLRTHTTPQSEIEAFFQTQVWVGQYATVIRASTLHQVTIRADDTMSATDSGIWCKRRGVDGIEREFRVVLSKDDTDDTIIIL